MRFKLDITVPIAAKNIAEFIKKQTIILFMSAYTVSHDASANNKNTSSTVLALLRQLGLRLCKYLCFH